MQRAVMTGRKCVDIAKIILFLAIMALLPYCIGAVCQIGKTRTDGNEVLEKWNFGMIVMYAIFEVWVLAGTFAKQSLTRVSAVYAGTLFLIICIGIWVKWHRKELVGFHMKRPQMEAWGTILFVLVVAGIVLQMTYVCVNMHLDDDDAYYVGMAVTSYFSDTISINHPYLGTPVELKAMANYVLSPYPVYCATWSRLLSLHPAILMRSALPAVNIAWCYVVYYLLAKKLFLRFSQRMEFMLLVILANIFGAFSTVSSSVFLLTRVWQGKGVIAAVFIPLLWYVWICLRKDGTDRRMWGLMFATVLGACLCSSMALFLCPILLGAFGLEYLIEKKSWKNVGKLVVCALPCLALAVVELYLVYK